MNKKRPTKLKGWPGVTRLIVTGNLEVLIQTHQPSHNSLGGSCIAMPSNQKQRVTFTIQLYHETSCRQIFSGSNSTGNFENVLKDSCFTV